MAGVGVVVRVLTWLGWVACLPESRAREAHWALKKYLVLVFYLKSAIYVLINQ